MNRLILVLLACLSIGSASNYNRSIEDPDEFNAFRKKYDEIYKNQYEGCTYVCFANGVLYTCRIIADVPIEGGGMERILLEEKDFFYNDRLP